MAYKSGLILIMLSIIMIYSIPLQHLRNNLSHLWQKLWVASIGIIDIHLCLMFLYIIKWMQVRLERMNTQPRVTLGYTFTFTSLPNVKQTCVTEWKYITCVHVAVLPGSLLLWSVFRHNWVRSCTCLQLFLCWGETEVNCFG